MIKKTRPTQPRKQRHTVFGSWFISHLRAMISSLGAMSRNPIGSFMTIAVIGISLTLPTGFYVLLKNARVIMEDWKSGVQITLFMHNRINTSEARALALELQKLDSIRTARFVSSEAALKEYRSLSGFSEALEMLDENPLPSLILLELYPQERKPEMVLETLRQRQEVEMAVLDQKWLQRLFVIIDVVEHIVYIFSSLLGIAVLLIIGNTIRLWIYNRRQEIEIITLFGGTSSFIRRPFLYGGFWFGLFGSVMAWILVTACLQFLSGPINTLSTLYASPFELVDISLREGGLLLAGGSGLGFLGSWIAVQRHLSEIKLA